MTLISIVGITLTTQTNARADPQMVDVSNHNGSMTVGNFADMLNNYEIKAVTTKISEGTYYQDWTARGNIQNALKAGLYVNGYHFARYSNITQAKREGQFAGATASEVGLPVGASLVADVEAEQQMNVSRETLNECNRVFAEEVQKYGYRCDIYTMSSWLNKMNISHGTGWIASYPYSFTNQNWYNTHNAWQYSSTKQFNGSYGNFDVSKLYTDFYTGGKVFRPNPNVVKACNDFKAFSVVNDKGERLRGTNVVSGSEWVSDKIVLINGEPYYRIATDIYLNQNATENAHKCIVNYVEGYGILSFNKQGNSYKDSNLKFKTGTEWKTDNIENIENVGLCYRVATNEYLPVKYTNGSGLVYN